MAKKRQPRVYIVHKTEDSFYGNYKSHSIEITTLPDGHWRGTVRTFDQKVVFHVGLDDPEKLLSLKDKIRLLLTGALLWTEDQTFKLIKKGPPKRVWMPLTNIFIHHDHNGNRSLQLSFGGWGASVPIPDGATAAQLADQFAGLSEVLQAQAKENGEYAPEELDTGEPKA